MDFPGREGRIPCVWPFCQSLRKDGGGENCLVGSSGEVRSKPYPAATKLTCERQSECRYWRKYLVGEFKLSSISFVGQGNDSYRKLWQVIKRHGSSHFCVISVDKCKGFSPSLRHGTQNKKHAIKASFEP